MRYRNIITGAEFESKSKISAPDWITVEEEPKKGDMPAGTGTHIAEEEPTEDSSLLSKKTATRKPAAKKKGAKK